MMSLGLISSCNVWEIRFFSEYPAGTTCTGYQDGEILCLVTRPGFDANAFFGSMSSTTWNALRDDSLPLLNRAAMGLCIPPVRPRNSSLRLLLGVRHATEFTTTAVRGRVPIRQPRVQVLET
jgi:hypothetical protein